MGSVHSLLSSFHGAITIQPSGRRCPFQWNMMSDSVKDISLSFIVMMCCIERREVLRNQRKTLKDTFL